MTPKKALQQLKREHPESDFDELYFKHDGLYMYFSHPKGVSASESIGQVYYHDPSTGESGPYAPYGNGMEAFHSWCESAKKVISLDGTPVKRIARDSIGTM